MKTKKPLISIVVITKNAPLLILTRCINCIRNQSYTNIEILLLDANDRNSPHKVALQEQLSAWDDIIYIEHPDNNEYVHGKNKAIQQATGKYITFLSSQDTMHTERIEEIYKTFAMRPNLTAVCTSMTIQENNHLEYSDYELFTESFEYLPQLVVQKSFYQKNGAFDADFVALCDEEFWFRLSKYGYLSHLVSEKATVSICVDDYNNYSDYNAAIACQQFIKRYEEHYKQNKAERKERYKRAAYYYKKANLYLRYIQFRLKSVSWRKRKESS